MHAANIRRQYFATTSRAKPRGDPRAAAEVSTLSYIRSSPASKNLSPCTKIVQHKYEI